MRMIDGEAEVVRWTDFDGTLAWRSGYFREWQGM